MPEWTPPPLLAERDDPARLRGTLGGSLLYERPEHAGTVAAVRALLAAPGPAYLEIGFDHGMKLLDHARRWPEARWLGVELRRRRVEAAAPHAPPNALLLRADARALLSTVVPAGRLSGVYVLFPTPASNPRHVLLTPALLASLARALSPDGVVHLATDVEGMFAHAEGLFAAWRRAEDPPLGPVLSRRERVCRRDGLPVWRASWAPPAEEA